MKVFVIPDVHLKPWVFDRADALLYRHKVDKIVFLGDLVDDFGQQENIALYNQTFDRLERFIMKHKDKFYYCFGNHDLSYKYVKMETGYSFMAQYTVVDRLRRLEEMPGNRIAVIHRFDKVLFSHAGLCEWFVEEVQNNDSIDNMIGEINGYWAMQLWQDCSPIWYRPQHGFYSKEYPLAWLQVVGHTPVVEPKMFGMYLSCDTFSTHRDGSPYGNQSFVIVDTKTYKYECVK